MIARPRSSPWRVLRWMALAFLAGTWLMVLAMTSGSASVPDRGGSAEAIVVFSGEPERVAAAIALHRATGLPVFFTSTATEPAEAAKLIAELGEGVHAHLGGRARDTFGNAVEAASWLRDRNLRGAWLVTGDAHMPRALTVLRHVWPEGRVLPHPVQSRQTGSDTGENLKRALVTALADLGLLRPVARLVATGRAAAKP